MSTTKFDEMLTGRIQLGEPKQYAHADPQIDLGHGCIIVDVIADVVTDAAADAAADATAEGGLNASSSSRLKNLTLILAGTALDKANEAIANALKNSNTPR